MMNNIDIRPASPEDASQCASILNDWIDETDWMPRVHTREDVKQHYREWVLPNRDVYIIGKPVEGYIALDRDEPFVTSLYCRSRGEGIGKRLLDHAKTKAKQELKLWTFKANHSAIRFYRREGFHQIDQSEGDNEEKLPDVLLQWRAG